MLQWPPNESNENEKTSFSHATTNPQSELDASAKLLDTGRSCASSASTPQLSSVPVSYVLRYGAQRHRMEDLFHGNHDHASR